MGPLRFPYSDAFGSISVSTTPRCRCPNSCGTHQFGPLSGTSDVPIDRRTPLGNPFIASPPSARTAEATLQSLTEAALMPPPPPRTMGLGLRVRLCCAFDDWLADPRGSDAEGIAARHGVSVAPRLATAEARGVLEEALERLVERVRDGESLRLLCHCYPAFCHGDSIKREINCRLGRTPLASPGADYSADVHHSLTDVLLSACSGCDSPPFDPGTGGCPAASSSSQHSAAGSIEPVCSACLLPRSRCFAAHHPVDGGDVWSDRAGLDGSEALCHTCGDRFSETAPWVAPPCPLRPSPDPEVDSVLDSYGYPITWSAVWSAHRALTLADQSYDSDGDEWAWHPEAQEQCEARRFVCERWPGPICPTCFAASCALCSYVFAEWDDARAVGDRGRLLCVACAPRGASLYDWMCSSDAALMAMDLGETEHERRGERPWAGGGPGHGNGGFDVGRGGAVPGGVG